MVRKIQAKLVLRLHAQGLSGRAIAGSARVFAHFGLRPSPWR